jgi:hypothetical protein
MEKENNFKKGCLSKKFVLLKKKPKSPNSISYRFLKENPSFEKPACN